jgi:hypothetical protein
MNQLTCPACRVETTPCHATVDFRGGGRHLRVTLRRVPAGRCPRCEATAFTPAIRAHLDELAATVADGLATRPKVTIERTRPGIRRAA